MHLLRKSPVTPISSFLVLFCVQESLAGYFPLSPRQCKAAVETIGEVLNSKDSDTVYKDTFVSPR